MGTSGDSDPGEIPESSSSSIANATPISSRKRPLRHPLPAFPLESRHFGDLLSKSPHDFHSTLCALIRNAKQRVYIASLYVGPAACRNQEKEEADLLTALSDASNTNEGVSIKIVLDQNRALRSVPVKDDEKEATTTSSAEAVSEAIKRSIYLFQVLPYPLEQILPNPLNEVAGVFHIKIYVVDDQLILSGANLANEYFCDRLDRYLQICEGGNGLVDFYATLVDILCRHSRVYRSGDTDGTQQAGDDAASPTTRREFLEEITVHFQDPNHVSAKELFESTSSSSNAHQRQIVAVGIPTFHAPKGFWSELKDVEYVTDIEATLNLLEEGSFRLHSETGDVNSNTNVPNNTHRAQVQLSSAYLNPTNELLDVLSKYSSVEMVTAGRLSHGFKPKDKAGNKGKDWIPTVFDHLADDCLAQLPAAKLYHWERPAWTFHGKGIWVREGRAQRNVGDDGSRDDDGADEFNETDTSGELAAAVVGSSNFGGRSFVRDMESNLLLVFPPASPSNASFTSSGKSCIATSFEQEWDDLLACSTSVDPKQVAEGAPPLPWQIRLLFPYIKSFF